MSKLAQIPISQPEEDEFSKGFSTTLDVVDKLFSVDVNNIEPTHQVTGLTNVLREDEVVEEKMLPQEEALKNAKDKHDGYFVVPQILADD